MTRDQRPAATDEADLEVTPEAELLPQLAAHLRENRTRLRHQWADRIQRAGLLRAMTPQEMAAETTSVYDNYVEVLETGSVEALQHYARDLSERIIPRGVETHEVVGIVRSEEHTSELQSRQYLVCRLLLEKKKNNR